MKYILSTFECSLMTIQSIDIEPFICIITISQWGIISISGLHVWKIFVFNQNFDKDLS